MSITARAARVDLQVARGADFAKAVQIWTPDTQLMVGKLVPGDVVWYDDLPETVYSVKFRPGSRVVVALRDGVLGDPWFEAPNDTLIFSARQRAITWCKAGFKKLVDPPDSWDVVHVEIPSQITADTIQMAMPAAVTQLILPGPYSWDLLCEVDGIRVRLMEGVMVTMTSHAVEPDYKWPPVLAPAGAELPG